MENFGAALIARIGREAPGVRLRFAMKPDKDSAPLREGAVDLETGVVDDTTAPEVRVQTLFRDRHIGVVRKRHPLSKGEVTTDAYAAGRHIHVSRDGGDRGLTRVCRMSACLARALVDQGAGLQRVTTTRQDSSRTDVLEPP